MGSVGIIGGADGPTAVFVSGSPAAAVILLLAAAALAGTGIWLFLRKREH
ncbi:MAG: sodium ion-translocating decarboxylase subunit beta [Oscillibacter sp.]|nr:sodium ion-translocating decarboxylase subunit beta [Oscillibacter sp.]